MPAFLRNTASHSLLRLASALLLVAGCSSGGTTTTDPGSITLGLSASSASVQQGGSTVLVATLSRIGAFTGTVNLTATGAPSGVGAAVTDVQTTGTVTTATVTITVGATTAPGAYSIVLHGTGSGVAEATSTFTLTVTAAPVPAYVLTLGSPTLTIAQGAAVPTTSVNVARTSMTAGITLSVDNLPTGVTAAFTQNPLTGDATTLTLTVAPTAPLGTFTNLLVRGVTPGLTDRTAPLSLIVAVAGNFSLTTTPSGSVSVTSGSNSPVTVNIPRTGGNTSDVTLTATGTLPTGLTVAFAPPSTTGTSSVLTVNATGTVPVGAYPIVIHGNTPGLGEQTANLTINVSAPTSATLMYDVSVCALGDRPVFVAVQDGGPTAPWQKLTPVNNVYQFTFHQQVLGAAYVTLGTGTSTINIVHFTLAEVLANGPGFCAPPLGGISVIGTVAHVTPGFVATVNFGGTTAPGLGNGNFQLTQVTAGVNDLVAYMKPAASMGSADRGFISRGLNPGNGGGVGTVDFTGANSFAPAVASGTVSGVQGGETVTHAMLYYTGTGANACTLATLYTSSPVTAGAFIGYGVPPANQVATDFHSIGIFAISGLFIATGRGVQEDFHSLGARLATPFVLPSLLPGPGLTTVSTPYKQLNMTVTPPADLNGGFSMLQTDNTVTGKTVFVSLSGPYIGGGPAALTVPDFSALAGWSNAWAPATGDALAWSLTGTGSVGTPCTEGHRFVQSSRTGQN